MEEIKVGEYVRDRAGNIAKVMKNHNTVFEIELNTGTRINQSEGFIVKHSKNIKDLIECGDYVNGYRIDNIVDGVLVNNAVGIDKSGVLTPIVQYEQDIKTILTKEQFEQNYYKLDLK